MIKQTVNVVIDIGGDTTKVVFSYIENPDKVVFGKLGNSQLSEYLYPSICYYNADKDEWVFGKSADCGSNETFDKLINIKDLLSLLNPAVDQSNKRIDQSTHYFKGHDYLKFYFPKLVSDNSKLLTYAIEKKRTFYAKQTPQQVCELFFDSLFDNFINPSMKELYVIHPEVSHYNITYTCIYPQGASEQYIDELERLVAKAGNNTVLTSVSSTKAIATFSYHCNFIGSQSQCLVFDIGDSTIAVSKVITSGAGINIDGADTHSTPLAVGGQTYDEMLADIVNGKLNTRTILGNTNQDGSVEQGTHHQQFRLLTELKNAKLQFANVEQYDKIFSNGIPITAEREVLIETIVTREEFLHGIVINGKNIGGANEDKYGPTSRICQYIAQELKLAVNKHVDCIILAGGVAQTYGLHQAVKDAVKSVNRKTNVVSLSNVTKAPIIDDNYDISQHDYPIYAAALGASIIATQKYKVKLVAPLSYGTFSISGMERKYYLSIILEKGYELNPAGAKKYAKSIRVGERNEVATIKEEFYSADTTQVIEVGSPTTSNTVRTPSPERLAAIRNYNLKVIYGGSPDHIIDFVDTRTGRKVSVPAQYHIREGIEYNRDGKAWAFVESDMQKNIKLMGGDARYIIPRLNGKTDILVTTKATEVK